MSLASQDLNINRDGEYRLDMSAQTRENMTFQFSGPMGAARVQLFSVQAGGRVGIADAGPFDDEEITDIFNQPYRRVIIGGTCDELVFVVTGADDLTNLRVGVR